jgi:glycine oxidase
VLDAVFVGGGVIGLASAWRAAQLGLRVQVLERDTAGSGASRVAAGILAPDGDPLGERSLRLYPDFVAALETDVGFWRCGTITADGVVDEDDASVDPRRLVAALAARVDVREGAEVVALRRDSVTLANGETIAAGRVVLCAGAWSGPPVRPVKGQVVRLRGELPVERMVRGDHVYVVPRRNGEVVVGATEEECGFDTTVTDEATAQLLREGCRLVPELAELEVVDVSAGLRPATPDHRPLIGEREDGVLLATGHYRNGILLAPVTAEILTGEHMFV